MFDSIVTPKQEKVHRQTVWIEFYNHCTANNRDHRSTRQLYFNSTLFDLPLFGLSPPVVCATDQWEINPAELALGQELGCGQFGLVFEGQWKKKKVAVKMVREECMSDDEFKEEAKVMM